MPNIKSAKKRVLITKKESVLNNDIKSSMKTAIKKVEKAATKEEAAKARYEAELELFGKYSPNYEKLTQQQSNQQPSEQQNT